MEELFLETAQGQKPLSTDIIEKYELAKGMTTPFTNMRVIGKNGDSTPKEDDTKLILEQDEAPQVFTAAEVIDFGQGADSQTPEFGL